MVKKSYFILYFSLFLFTHPIFPVDFLLANNSKTEAGALCTNEALCTGTNRNSSLSRLVESIPQCPKFTIKQQILRDQKSSLTTDSPDEICSASTVNNLNHFKDAGELESYLQQNPFFAELNKNQSSTLSRFSSCLSQNVSTPMGFLGTSIFQFTRTLPENKRKLAVAEYYSSLKRLSDGVERSLQNITAIDLMIGEEGGLLKDVSCSSFDPLSREVKSQCQSVKQCSNTESSSPRNTVLEESAKDTLLALQAIGAIEKEIKKLKGPMHRKWRKNKESIQELEERKQSLRSLYPWIVGKEFKDGYNFGDYIGWNLEDPPEKRRKFEDKMAGLIKDQLTHTRAKLKERKEDFIKASFCIKGEEALCEELDMAKTLAKAPPINHEEVFERERAKELKQKSEGGKLNPEEKREYRRLLTKVGEADGLFQLAGCLQQQRKAVRDVNKELALGALDVGIVIGTMGLGTPYAAGRIALRVGSGLSKAEKMSKVRRLQGVGIFGTDASLSTPYMKEAMNICEDDLNQLEEMQQTANKDTNEEVCKKLPIRAKHTSDLKSCILQASLASLPITLPLLGLSGLAVAKRLRASKANSPIPPSFSAKKMEREAVDAPQKRKLSSSEIDQELTKARQQLKRMKFTAEADLKTKGYDSSMTMGMDEAHKLNFIGNKLRSLEIDPKKTHIPFFEDQADEHFEFIKKGLSKKDELYEEKITALNKLYDDIQKQIKKKELSYEYWLKWNYDLLYSVSSKRERDRPRHVLDLDRFPPSEGLFLPTTGEWGPMALNTVFSNNMFPLGLVNKPTIADGSLYSPVGFFTHDITHSYYSFEGNIANNATEKGSMKAMYKTIEDMNLSIREREMAELAYFMHFHEKYGVSEQIERYLNSGDFGSLLPSHVDTSNLKAIDSYTNEAEELFDKILERARTQHPDFKFSTD